MEKSSKPAPDKPTPSAPEATTPAAPATQPQPQVQYIVAEKSLKGVGGWLIFWLISFSLAAIVYIYTFFAAMLIDDDSATAIKVILLIFTPILAAAYIASVVLISMQKRLGKLLALITLGISALYGVILTITTYVVGRSELTDRCSSYSNSYYSSYSTSSCSSGADQALPMVIAAVLATLVAHGLVMLYFFLSKRVKETLVQ